MFDQAIVLGVEHMVHGGQADVLVDPAVTGHEVGVEQLVVIGASQAVVDPGHAISIGHQRRAGLAVERVGRVRDIVEETMTGAQRQGGVHGCSQAGLDQAAGGDQLRHAVSARDEVAVLVGGQQRHPADILIVQFDAQHVTSLGLEHAPGGHTAKLHVVLGAENTVAAQIAVGQQFAGDHGLAVDQHIGPQEHLVRGVRAVGLVLVDERRGLVDVHTVTVRVHLDAGTGNHHEVGLRCGRVVQRVVRLQRNEDEAVAALVDEVQAMVEKLAEEGEPGVEASRKPFVRRSVGDK